MMVIADVLVLRYTYWSTLNNVLWSRTIYNFYKELLQWGLQWEIKLLNIQIKYAQIIIFLRNLCKNTLFHTNAFEKCRICLSLFFNFWCIPQPSACRGKAFLLSRSITIPQDVSKAWLSRWTNHRPSMSRQCISFQWRNHQQTLRNFWWDFSTLLPHTETGFYCDGTAHKLSCH